MQQQQQQITIELIETKEFRIRARGYDQDEVDLFLDEICDEMERQEKRTVELEKQLNAAQGELLKRQNAPAPAPVQQQPASSDDVRDMLEYAQRIKNEMLEKAEQQAKTILAEAQKQAEAQLGDLTGRRDALKAEIETLQAAVTDYRARFSALLEEQQALLNKAGL